MVHPWLYLGNILVICFALKITYKNVNNEIYIPWIIYKLDFFP